jgi:AbrB family looped-hinge helix DNA binding protein
MLRSDRHHDKSDKFICFVLLFCSTVFTLTSKTRVTRKYQVTIPKEVRRKVGVEVGDEFKVTDKGELIVLQKVSKAKGLLAFAGCWRGYPENPEEFMKDIRSLWSSWKA